MTFFSHISHILFLLLICHTSLQAQFSVNTDGSDPHSSAVLDVQSTTKGLLIPRMTTRDREKISDPAMGLIIYNTEDSCFNYYTGNKWVKDCGLLDGVHNHLSFAQDGDSDPANEFQFLNLDSLTLSISDGNSVDFSSIYSDNQNLSIDNNGVLSISGGNSVDLSSLDTDTDDQTLSLSGYQLSIENGNSVDLSTLLPPTDDQTLSLANNLLSIEQGNTVILPTFFDNLGNHIATQNLQLQGNWISPDGSNKGIYVNNNGYVGIGTSSLAEQFQIKYAGQGDSTGIKLSNDDVHSRIYHQSGDLYIRKQSRPNQLVLDATGRIGIGTNSPSHLLTIYPSATPDGEEMFLIDGVDNEQVADALEVVDEDNNPYFTIQSTGSGSNDQGKVIVYGQLQITRPDPDAGKVLLADDQGNGIWTLQPTKIHRDSSELDFYTSSSNWRDLTSWTDYTETDGEGTYKFNGSFTTRLTGGTNDDDYEIRVEHQCGNGTTGVTDTHVYRPGQASTDHDNFKELTYFDYKSTNCGSSGIRFRLMARNLGDDDWEVRDRVLFVTSYY